MRLLLCVSTGHLPPRAHIALQLPIHTSTPGRGGQGDVGGSGGCDDSYAVADVEILPFMNLIGPVRGDCDSRAGGGGGGGGGVGEALQPWIPVVLQHVSVPENYPGFGGH